MKLKDKKIEILAVQSVINENGYAVETLEPICPPVWAYFRHLSGREYHAAMPNTCRKKCCSRSTGETTSQPRM